jgi:hypothetical protein
MVFEPDDIGPWWFSTDEIQESRRHDIIDNNSFKMVNRTRAQLAQALKDAGITVESSRPANELKGHNFLLKYLRAQVCTSTVFP